MQAATELLIDRTDHVVTLTLNRPALRNALSSPALIAALVGALDQANADNDVRALVLTGAGDAFSSGGDVRNMHRLLDARATDLAGTRRYYVEGIQTIALAFDRLEVPIVAAVNGPAIGGGLDLACMCDLRLAGSRARFAESFVRLGLVSGDGGYWLLPRIVGYAKALELALTGDAIDAQEAHRIGLVARVVADDALHAEAMDVARRIAANPPAAVRAGKRLLKSALASPLGQHLDAVTEAQALLHASPEHRAAVEAAVERLSRGK